MDSKIWIRRLLSTCLVVTIITTYSTVALAGSEKIAGELLVTGKAINGSDPFVKINGENAQTGRSIFTGSVISTPENVGALLNLGKLGEIELAPNTIMSLSFNEKEGINGDLIAGRVTVVKVAESISVKTAEGEIVTLKTGESAGTTKAQTNDDDSGSSLLIYAVILGGAAAGIVYAATRDNTIALGGGTTVVSTTR